VTVGNVNAKIPVGAQGRPESILCNAFHMELSYTQIPELYSYSASLDGAPSGWRNAVSADLKNVIESLWDKISEVVNSKFLFVGQLMFTTKKIVDFALKSPTGNRTLELKFLAAHGLDTIYTNPAAQKVYDHIMRKACSALTFEKIGRRYYSGSEVSEFSRNTLAILKGFAQQLMWLPKRGPYCILDVTYKPLFKKNVLEVLQSTLPDPDSVVGFHDPMVQSEWRRRLVESTVCTLYNNRMYKIRRVLFDLDPQATFEMKYRDKDGAKKTRSITYAEYFGTRYDKKLVEPRQPLLEAYAEKKSEKVILVPELCALTGFTEELRKDRSLLTDAMKHGKVSAQERFNSVMKMNGPFNTACKTVSEWGVEGISSSPLEVKARVLDDVEVDFGQKSFKVEDGQFQKWLRNGLQNPVYVDDWLFIFPETDHAVLDIWLQSLRDIGLVAFRIEMSEPKRITVTDQKKDLPGILEANVTPSTQLVLLLTPQADAMRVYQTLKTYTCSRYPVATQVVKSETIRKRQSIAAVLSRIVLQINAKLSGPLWHVNLKTEGNLAQQVANNSVPSFFDRATMVVGVDLYFGEEGLWMGCVATMDPNCAEYLSLPYFIEYGGDLARIKSRSLQKFLHEALTAFLEKNKCLPVRILVYRGSATQNLYPEIRETEAASFKYVIENFMKGYRAALTFVVCSKRVGLRFFKPRPNEANIANPDSGTVIDTTVTIPGVNNFYLINHACAKGTSSPTHYLVLVDESHSLLPDALQVLTYRLSFMYFNFAGSTKFPAPLMYAQKLATFSATAVSSKTHHPRLKNSLYYL